MSVKFFSCLMACTAQAAVELSSTMMASPSWTMAAENVAWYFIVYHDRVVPVVAYLSSVTEDGKIDRLNILPM